MKNGIEKVISYKTKDGRIFTEENKAITHTDKLNKEEEFDNLVTKVRKVFLPDISAFDNTIEDEYDVSLEVDFWENKNSGLDSDIMDMDVCIESFNDYVLLIKALLKHMHLKEVVKIIDQTTKNQKKET